MSDVARTRWLFTVTAAETLGYLAPALTGILTTRAGWSQQATSVAVVAAGCVEGFALGFGQASALPVPVRRARFALLTAAGAGTVWATVMSMMLLGPTLLLAALAIPIGLFAIGVAQWLELRHHTLRAWPWIGWTAVAWIAALPLSLLPGPLVDERTPLVAHVLLWGLGGALMAFVMSMITWQGVRRLRWNERCT